MCELRLHPKAEAILTTAAKSADPVKIFKLLASLFGETFMEIKTTTRFSAKDGSPKTKKWTPYEKKEPIEIYLDRELLGPSIVKKDPAFRPITKTLPRGKITVVKIDQRYICIEHVGEGMDDGQNAAYLFIREAVNLK